MHSSLKYLGHSDVVAGALIAKTADGRTIAFQQFATGTTQTVVVFLFLEG
jgi:cystathionine beta-lyase/cystathionine gamma-synthase